MTQSASTRLCAWITPEQIPLLAELLDLGGYSLEAVGHDGRSGEASQMGEALGVQSCTSPRQLGEIASQSIVLLGVIPDMESEVLRDTLGGASHVITLEPCPDTIRSISGDALISSGRPWVFAPLWRATEGMRTLHEAIEASTPPRVVSLSCVSPLGCASLGARLFDAMDAVLSLSGEPEWVDAMIHAPRHGGFQLQAGNRLTTLFGEMTVHVRGIEGVSATVTLSDRGGRWTRSLLALGDAGIMRCEHDRFSWTHADGEAVEDDDADAGRSFARSVHETIQRELDIHSPTWRPVEHHRVLAMCEAALLSARTGQPESPATIMRMSGVETSV
ncbi:MAG: hypothetical protein ACF8GE_12185 [Phycisphaerales bacterium JB043]